MIKNRSRLSFFFYKFSHNFKAFSNKSKKSSGFVQARRKGSKSSILNLNKTQILYSSLIISLFIGAVVGAILANKLDILQFTEISDYLSKFISSLNSDTINKNDLFLDSILKYSKTAFIIWVMGFITQGIFITYGVIIFKGLTCGFTTALLLKEFGLNGLVFAAVSYLPQNLLLLPMYIALSYYSINQLKTQGSILKRKRSKKALREYCIILIILLVIIIISSLIESYLISYFMKNTAQLFS